MNAVVTGGAGFIGGHIARALAADGWSVRVFDNLSEGAADSVACEVDLVEADLRDAAAVRSAIAGAHVVFHQGGLRSVPRSMEYPAEYGDINVLGTLNVLMAAAEHGARVVAASSSSVYGDQSQLPLREDMMLRPKSPYAASKAALESFCGAYARGFGVPTICLRYFTVYGPRQNPRSQYAIVIPLFINACLSGERPVVHGDGLQSRDFTYVDDVVQANLKAAAAPPEASGLAYNIAAGRTPVSVSELLTLIGTLTHTTPDPVYQPERAGDVRHTQADTSLAQRLFGYEPTVDIAEGLRRTVEAFRS